MVNTTTPEARVDHLNSKDAILPPPRANGECLCSLPARASTTKKRQVSELAEPSPADIVQKEAAMAPDRHLKHGFYSACFLTCSRCPYKELCTRHNEFRDSWGAARCVYETELFTALFSELEAEYAHKPQKEFIYASARILIFDFLLYLRGLRYISRKGLVQNIPIKDEKTGQVFKIPALNIVKKDMWYHKKSILEFLSTLNLSPEAKALTSVPDIAVIMSKDKTPAPLKIPTLKPKRPTKRSHTKK